MMHRSLRQIHAKEERQGKRIHKGQLNLSEPVIVWPSSQSFFQTKVQDADGPVLEIDGIGDRLS